VWFLLKSLLVLIVIFVLASRDRSQETQSPATARIETARRAAPAHEGDAIETLKKAATQKLADGVREQCFKRPEDCFALSKTVGAGLSAFGKAR
jgi:hypothetical protein